MNDENEYKLNGKIENSFWKIINLQSFALQLATYHQDLTIKYFKNVIPKKYYLEQSKIASEGIRSISGEIQIINMEINSSFNNRKINKKNKIRYDRKIDGINIKTFRQLTTDLYGEHLPKECLHCNSKENLTIHHLRYKYPIDIKDLVRLCRSCHTKLELKIRKARKQTQF